MGMVKIEVESVQLKYLASLEFNHSLPVVHSKMSVWDLPRGLENKEGEKFLSPLLKDCQSL